jgi:hypothetical protein
MAAQFKLLQLNCQTQFTTAAALTKYAFFLFLIVVKLLYHFHCRNTHTTKINAYLPSKNLERNKGLGEKAVSG